MNTSAGIAMLAVSLFAGYFVVMACAGVAARSRAWLTAETETETETETERSAAATPEPVKTTSAPKATAPKVSVPKATKTKAKIDPVSEPNSDPVTLALIGLGFARGLARAASRHAAATCDPVAPLEARIREALRACPTRATL